MHSSLQPGETTQVDCRVACPSHRYHRAAHAAAAAAAAVPLYRNDRPVARSVDKSNKIDSDDGGSMSRSLFSVCAVARSELAELLDVELSAARQTDCSSV